jgi:hypothetical protein
MLKNIVQETQQNMLILSPLKSELMKRLEKIEKKDLNLIFQYLIVQFGLNYFQGIHDLAEEGMELLLQYER